MNIDYFDFTEIIKVFCVLGFVLERLSLFIVSFIFVLYVSL